MDAADAREDEALRRGDDRGYRPGRGELARAREVIAQDVAATIAAATDDVSPDTAHLVARRTIAAIRPDRLADYCALAKAHAEEWKQAGAPIYDGALPIPLEMRADQAPSAARTQSRTSTRDRQRTTTSRHSSTVITGYEIDTDDSTVAKQRAAELTPHPHVRSEEIIRALKEKIASTPHSVPYSAAEVNHIMTESETPAEREQMRNSIFVGTRWAAQTRKNYNNYVGAK